MARLDTDVTYQSCNIIGDACFSHQLEAWPNYGISSYKYCVTLGVEVAQDIVRRRKTECKLQENVFLAIVFVQPNPSRNNAVLL